MPSATNPAIVLSEPSRDPGMPEHRSMPQRVLSGFVALSATSLLVMICQLGYAAVTARLLPIDAFGAYAVALSGVGLLSLANGSTLGLAAARRSEADPAADRALVTVSLATGAGVMVLAMATATLWSALWDVPEAAPVMVVLATGTPFVSLSAVLAGVLRRQGRTPVVARRSAAAQLLGMVVGLVAVLEMRTAWSLAVASVAGAVISTTLFGVRMPRQAITPSKPTRELAGDVLYSSKAAGMNLLRYGANLLTPWSIGRYSGVDALGAYNRATTVVTVPLDNLQTALSYSLFPELRHDGPVFAKATAFTQLMVLVTWPAVIAAGLGVFGAGPFLTVLLGPQWGAAAAIGGLAVMLGVIPMLGVPALSAVEALGEFRISVVAWVMALMAIGIGSGWTLVTGDPRWAILGLVAAKAGSALVALSYLARTGRFQFVEYVRGVLPILLVQALVVAGLALATGTVVSGAIGQIILVAVVGFVELAILHAVRRRTSFGRIAQRLGLPGFR